MDFARIPEQRQIARAIALQTEIYCWAKYVAVVYLCVREKAMSQTIKYSFTEPLSSAVL